MPQNWRGVLATAFILILTGCGSSTPEVTNQVSSVPSIADPSVPPIAAPGADQATRIGKTISLGVSNQTLTGGVLTYSWSISSAPNNSLATLITPTEETTTFTPDFAGQYAITFFVDSGFYSDQQTVTITATAPTIDYPTGITWMNDLAYDPTSKSFWALAGDSTSLDTLLQIDAQTGQVLSNAPNNEFFLNHGSEMTWDGQYLWATSYGWNNGVPQSFIYQIDTSGSIVAQFPCPTTVTGGFCEGLAWDGTYLWSGASDNMDIAKFTTAGSVAEWLPDFWSTIGRNQSLDFDSTTGKLLAIKGSQTRWYEPFAGTTTASPYTILYNQGAWDGELYWFVNNSTQKIESAYLPTIN